MIPSTKHSMRRIIIKFNHSASFACIIKFTVEYVRFFFWCGCNCNQNIPNYFEERKAQMEDWSVQLKYDVFVERFVILEHGMVNSKGYLLFFSLFFYTRWWFLFLQKKGILCLCAQLPIAEQLPFIPICCMPFQPGKKNCEWLWQHSLKSTHILKQRNKQKK